MKNRVQLTRIAMCMCVCIATYRIHDNFSRTGSTSPGQQEHLNLAQFPPFSSSCQYMWKRKGRGSEHLKKFICIDYKVKICLRRNIQCHGAGMANLMLFANDALLSCRHREDALRALCAIVDEKISRSYGIFPR